MTRTDILPADALKILKEGNKRFLDGISNITDHREKVQETSGGQLPFAAILSCMDSRVAAELVFDQGIGDLVNVRVAGNIVNNDVLASLEFSCTTLKTKLILILGHTGCGAVVSACDQVDLGNITELLTRIRPAIEAESATTGQRNGSNMHFVNNVCALNVENSMMMIRRESDIIRKLESDGEIMICGAMYDIKTGRVSFM